MNRREDNSPMIMAAINGARRDKKYHPALPISVGEIANDASECFDAGADALHLHIRDEHGEHSLDAGQYRETVAEIKKRAPDMLLQITTESAGKYSPPEQRQLLYDLRPQYASASVSEMTADNDIASARRMYHWAAAAGVHLQHIAYSPAEVLRLSELAQSGVLPNGANDELPVLFVLGSYAGENGKPEMLIPFLAARQKCRTPMPFMTCAFGELETECLLASAKAGGDCRAGFENNIRNRDGSIARNNAERIAEIAALLRG